MTRKLKYIIIQLDHARGACEGNVGIAREKKGKEMKRMRFVTKGLVLLMMGAMLAGCSDTATEDSSESKKSSVEEQTSSEEKSTEAESADASTAASTAASTDAGTEESSGEVESSSSEETSQAGPVGGNEDLVAAYAEELKNFTMEGKMISMKMNMASQGLDVDIEMKMGSTDDVSYLYMGVPVSGSAASNCIEMYFLKDSSAYLKMNAAGQETIYKTANLDQETADEMNLAGSFSEVTGGISDQTDNMEYFGQENVDGTNYDVCKVKKADGVDEMYVYFNVMTKQMEHIKAVEDGQTVMMQILPMEVKGVPAGFESAVEQDGETFAMTMMMGMVNLFYGTGGINLD